MRVTATLFNFGNAGKRKGRFQLRSQKLDSSPIGLRLKPQRLRLRTGRNREFLVHMTSLKDSSRGSDQQGDLVKDGLRQGPGDRYTAVASKFT
jgi:hypothetical protein